MTLVVGTAGHIDHGKTTLLRALTGIDADRLPEERRRGMTIDVGYAHLALANGAVIDFVDVPGHDRLVGNMLVGAGEIDAAMLVVAADDGPRAQTLEHLALLDALGIDVGLAVVTKVDAVEPARVDEVVAAVERLLAATALVAAPILPVSAVTGQGIEAVRDALAVLAPRSTPVARPASLAIDRVFSVKGRGLVVTGSLRGGSLARGDVLRLVPGPGAARIRELQVHGRTVERVEEGGRVAANLAGIELDAISRGDVLTVDPARLATDRLLAAFRSDPADRSRWRLHLGTASVDAAIGRGGRDALEGFGIVRLASLVAARPGDRFVLRRSGAPPVGGVVLDVAPPRGISRRRQTFDRLRALEAAVAAAGEVHARAARLELHGALVGADGIELAPDVMAVGTQRALTTVDAGPQPLAQVRTLVARDLRRLVTLRRDEALAAAAILVERLVAAGRLVRDGDEVRRAGVVSPGPDPVVQAAMERLVAALDVSAPPPLTEVVRTTGCPPEAIQRLERDGRIVVLDRDLAYALPTYQRLAARAIAMARRAPLTPAAFRDGTGTSRKYVMAILEDLDRRALLRRTPAGHVPGPRAPVAQAPVDRP